MAFQLHRFAETLASPDAVSPSRSEPGGPSLLPALPGPERQELLHLPCGEREADCSFILTAYPGRSIKGEGP